MIIWVTQPSPFECAFPLSGTEFSGSGVGSPTMTGGGQTGSFILPAGSGEAAAVPAGALLGTSQKADLSAGTKAVQVRWDAVQLIGSGDGTLTAALRFVTADAFERKIGAEITTTAGGYSLDIWGGDATAETTISLGATLPTHTTLVMDSVAGTFAAYDDAGTLIIGGLAYPAGLYLPQLAYEYQSIAGAAIGDTCTTTFVSSVLGMTGLPAVTATDLCGNAIG